MRVLVTGSAGHLGEALVRTLKELQYDVVALDLQASPFTTQVGSITDRAFVKQCLVGVKTVFHTATLHKPHVATHSQQEFIDTNITGTLNLLQESVAAGVEQFIFTSTTSVFGDALVPPVGDPAAWITEGVVPVPKNIYGVTKAAAENLCQLFFRNQGLPCIVLRTSRFFPEADDSKEARNQFADDNLKANEYLFRRVALDDVVSAHLVAVERAQAIGFGTFIISATTPFLPEDTADLRIAAPAVLQKYIPDYQSEYERRGWQMFPGIDRVYVNEKARKELGWQPKYDFRAIIEQLKTGRNVLGPLAERIGSKGYHAERFSEGPYPVEP
ncbi:NAD-dependent epimerase/dehydratase family protein [Larkinella terrae]|uniref:NAD-dependent epimerase/dehydratase family protein n=1 Tax=Larkinella terrae TaxID=2025311 RepID=A0A7K0EQ85_9BACT|nr:NAD(P)-dependent oxidoreductase [Larkinella terrae]MRS63959.1 NAD-dependent epimerase/dehydratase family protein [Larkinella terrae]